MNSLFEEQAIQIDTVSAPIYYGFSSGVLGDEWHQPVQSGFGWQVLAYDNDQRLGVNNVPDDGMSELYLQVQFDQSGGVVEFEIKVDTESNSDFFTLYIDDNAVLKRSGDEDWETFISNPLSEGTHMFRWEYKKDESGSSSGDAVYIDNLNFRY